MGEMRQSPALRTELKAAWDKQPLVQQFADEAEAFAWKHDLKFDAEGLTRMLQEFGAPWIAEHGPLPDSGILIG